MPPAVIVPLRKSVRITDGESVRTLRPGQLHVAEGDRVAGGAVVVELEE